jgi:hypothetical protein
VTIGDDSIKTNFVKVWCFEFQHFVNAFSIDFIRCLDELLGRAFGTAKTLLNQLLTVFVQQIESVKVGAR